MPNTETGEVIEKWDIINQVYPVSAVSLYGNALVVKRTAKGKVSVKRPEVNKVSRLSRSSLNRLAFTITTTKQKFLSILTLTYEKIPTNGREVKAQLNHFLTYLRRRFRHHNLEYVWFLEFQKRGAPHFHMLLNISVPIVSRETILRKWVDITGGSSKALRVTLHKRSWENIRLEDGAKRYAIKYALKPEQKIVPIEYSDVGRFWGTSRGVKSQPIVEEFPVNEVDVRRMISEVRPNDCHVFSKFVPKYIFF